MNGIIRRIEDHGSIVILWIDVEDDLKLPVYMDHRPFAWMIEAEGDLIGRPVSYNGETIEFTDTLEAV